MDKKNPYHSLISKINKNMQYHKEMMALSKNPYQRNYHENMYYNEKMRLNYWQMYYYNQYKNHEESKRKISGRVQTEQSEQTVFTLEELAKYDGANGRPAYVAVNGMVYDVSLERTWGGGTHFSLYAGKDLTAQFNGCHGGNMEVLRNLPQVGVLKE